MERVLDTTTPRNKLFASIFLVVAMAGTLLLSWFASPDPFVVVIERSTPMIIMFIVIITITSLGASMHSRAAGAIFFFVAAILYIFFFTAPEWGVPHVLIGITFITDIGISVFGCKSPMVANANDNFLVIASLFFAGFVVGLFFEFMNDSILHLWSLNVITFYPMVSIFGINVMVMITWAFVGILLYEFSLLIGICIKFFKGNKKEMCTI